MRYGKEVARYGLQRGQGMARALSGQRSMTIAVPPRTGPHEERVTDRFLDAPRGHQAAAHGLTSNVRSVSCLDKEARVTKHDAERQVKILDFIASTLRARGYPPSVREIARAVGLASTSAVHHHLQILEREGYLERGAAQSRAIR